MARKPLFSVTRKDFVVETMTAGGPGGQNQNKVETAVRITHPESGARGESRSERSQYTNKKIAFSRLAQSPTFMAWVRRKVRDLDSEQAIEAWAEEQIKPENIKVEVKSEKGTWVQSDQLS